MSLSSLPAKARVHPLARHYVLLGLGLLGLAACNDPFRLGPATFTNRIDTLDLYAVNGTPLDKPSAYQLQFRTTIRLGLDATSAFDFLYRIDPEGPGFYPYAAVAPRSDQSSLGQPGFVLSATPFNQIKEALQTGYITDKPARLEVGQTYFARSSVAGCFLGIPYYAKLEVLSFNAALRSIKFRILVNSNCGYRALVEGIPEK